MNDLENLYFLVGYLEGLKDKKIVLPKDLNLVKEAIDNNLFFHVEDLSYSEEESNSLPMEEPETYNDYNDSYSQDSEGWSDQMINSVLDGNSDAYWNLD